MNKKKQLTREEVKQVELGILDYINSICKEHKIEYFLDYGTLLGAIRHNGFIPWDDDIDICMTRKDYERFVSIFFNNEKSNYKLLSMETSSSYYYEFGKVIDTRTILNETETIALPGMGVWVDIFPKDNLTKRHKLLKWIVTVLVVCRVFAVYQKFPKKHNILFYPVWLISRLIGYKPFLKLTKRLSIINVEKETPYIGDLRDLTAKQYAWNKEMFSKSVFVPFEGKEYPAPQNWDGYLRGLYGDYMKLPPEDKRIPHNFEAYWK